MPDVRKPLAVVVLCLVAGGAAAQEQEGAPKRVMVFGDSNSWGWMPIEAGTPTTRYGPDERWPTLMQSSLGEGYVVVEEALSGRTTNVDDPPGSGRNGELGGAGLNGAAYLPAALASHLPLDLVVVMLGTNDTKSYFDRTPLEIGLGAMDLVSLVQTIDGGIGTDYPAPEVLLVAPPPLGEQKVFDVFSPQSVEISGRLGEVMGNLAGAADIAFLDASEAVPVLDGVDGVHMTPEAQKKLGGAVTAKVREVLE